MSNATCLIIGYGPGVGHGIAAAFGKAGYDLILCSRNPKKHASAIAELTKKGIEVQVESLNAADTASIGISVARWADTANIEVLAYNAVVPTFMQPTQLDPEQTVMDLRINVVGALAATKAVLPAMKSGGKGCILFTGGGWAYYPWDQAASPSMGKAALRSLAMTLSQELSDSPIRVGLVSIMGEVAPGTAFDPMKIGEAFLNVVKRDESEHETETMFTGS
ncbi:SDR family NAD(P)-dependent oxidoreductase [Pirellulaceae bacterium SH449]